MVGEFPELQGVMGRYYALHDGERPAVADAIRDHYAPKGPTDAVPTAPVSHRGGAGRQARPARRFLRASARSRPAPAIPTRSAAPRWASSASSGRTAAAALAER